MHWPLYPFGRNPLAFGHEAVWLLQAMRTWCWNTRIVTKTAAFKSEHCPQYPEDEDGDGPRNVGFFAIEQFDAAGSPRRFYYMTITAYY
jgi:hypothetical protein